MTAANIVDVTWVGFNLADDLFVAPDGTIIAKPKGGGAVNATRSSLLLKQKKGLGGRVRLIAIAGADDVAELQDLSQLGADVDVIVAPGHIRTNRTTLPGSSEPEYGLCELAIRQAQVELIFAGLNETKPGAWVGILGSLAPGVTPADIAEMIKLVHSKKGRVILDTRPDVVREVLEYCRVNGIRRPEVIKLNLGELHDLARPKELNGEAQIEVAVDPQSVIEVVSQHLPAGNTIVSLGKEAGIVWATPDSAWHVWIEKTNEDNRYNPVGCGDSLDGWAVLVLSELLGIVEVELNGSTADHRLIESALIEAAIHGIGAATANVFSPMVVPGMFEADLAMGYRSSTQVARLR